MPPCYKETNGAGGSEAFARGYGKPPAHSRFTPGQSGNPKGRPKGARNRAAAPGHQENRLQSIILDEAYRGVPVNDGKRQVTIPMAQAVVRSLAVNAAKGSQRAQRLFTTSDPGRHKDLDLTTPTGSSPAIAPNHGRSRVNARGPAGVSDDPPINET